MRRKGNRVRKVFPFIWVQCEICRDFFIFEPVWKVNRADTVYPEFYCRHCSPKQLEIFGGF